MKYHELCVMQGFRPPYWGFIFSNNQSPVLSAEIDLFPSPTGVLYSLILTAVKLSDLWKKVSVPYWGSIFSNFEDIEDSWTEDVKFPSPTGVLYSLIQYRGTLYLFEKCFRPLLGFYIL